MDLKQIIALQGIDAVLASMTEHSMRERPVDKYSNLSEFVCSCGAVFTPSSLLSSDDRRWPSLPFVHRALMTTLNAVAVTGGVSDAPPLLSKLGSHEIPDGAVFHKVDGRLFRKLSPARWLTQEGKVVSNNPPHPELYTLVWAPAPTEGTDAS